MQCLWVHYDNQERFGYKWFFKLLLIKVYFSTIATGIFLCHYVIEIMRYSMKQDIEFLAWWNVDPSIVIDARYATVNNFIGQVLYPDDKLKMSLCT